VIVVFDVVEGGQRLTNRRKFIDAGPGTPDGFRCGGFRCDVDDNLWCGWGMGPSLYSLYVNAQGVLGA